MWVAPPSFTDPGHALRDLDAGMIQHRNQLRREMRARRRAVPPAERIHAARQFASVAARALLLTPGKRIGVYLAHHHEADLSRLIERARRNGCDLYAPSIIDRRSHRMALIDYPREAPLRINHYGISEPDPAQLPRAPVRHLDVILVPLLAVDARGRRLGSGAGYYDRCLAHLRAGRVWRRPKLIGVAYAFQQVPALDAEPWDVPLDALLTERGLHHYAGHLERQRQDGL